MVRPGTAASIGSLGSNALEKSLASAMSVNMSSVELLRREMAVLRQRTSGADLDLKDHLEDSARWFSSRVPKPAGTDQRRTIRADGTVNRPRALLKGVVAFVMLGVRLRLRRERREREVQAARDAEAAEVLRKETEEEKEKGDSIMKIFLEDATERAKLQKDWLTKAEEERTRKLTQARDMWAKRYEDCRQWPFTLLATKAQTVDTGRNLEVARGQIVDMAGRARTAVRTARIKGVPGGTVLVEQTLEGAMRTLEPDVKTMHAFNVDNDVASLRRLRETSADEVKRMQAYLTGLREQDVEVARELARRRNILRKALAPGVQERASLKVQWGERLEREHEMVNQQVETHVGYRARKFEEAEAVRERLFQLRSHVAAQEEVVAALDGELAELERMKEKQSDAHKTEISAARKLIAKQLRGLRATRGFKKAWEEKRPLREADCRDRAARCRELQRQVDEVQERLFAKNEAQSRLQMAALGTITKRPRDEALRGELERLRLHHVEYPDIEAAMRDFFKQVEEGEDVDFQAGCAYVHIRYPFIHPNDRDTRSMLDEAFEAAFMEEGGDSLADEERKKQVKQELMDYGLTQDELRGMGLVQLEALLKGERDAAAEAAAPPPPKEGGEGSGSGSGEESGSGSGSGSSSEDEEEGGGGGSPEGGKQGGGEGEEDPEAEARAMEEEERRRRLDRGRDPDEDPEEGGGGGGGKAAAAEEEESSDSDAEDNREAIKNAIADAQKAAEAVKW